MTKKQRPKSPPVAWPESYDELVRQLMREHPGHSRAEIEAAIREAQAQQATKAPS
jgi:hypothetical protein